MAVSMAVENLHGTDRRMGIILGIPGRGTHLVHRHGACSNSHRGVARRGISCRTDRPGHGIETASRVAGPSRIRERILIRLRPVYPIRERR